MFFLLIIIGWTMYMLLPHVPNFLWVCYALAWAVWLVRFGYKIEKW